MLLGSTRPLVELTLAINYAIGRLDPWGYHLVNLFIHLTAGLIVYGVCRQTFRTPRLSARYGPAATPLAFSIALLWLLHPLQTQSVTYLSQRAEALMGLWALLTLYATCRASVSGAAQTRWTVLAISACALGMLSKPVMVVIPLLVLAYDRIFLSESLRAALRTRRGLYRGLVASWALLALVVATMTPEEEATVGFHVRAFTPWEYAATQAGVIWHYVRLALWPHPLVLDYHWPIARTISATLVPALGLVVLLLLIVRAVSQRSPAGFLGLWVAGTLAPTSSVFPLADLIFEHRMYLPLAGLIGFAVPWGWTRLQRIVPTPSRRRVLAAALMLSLTAAYTTVTIRRNRDYRSELRIWADTVAKQPENTRARLTFGYALAQRKRYDEALAQFQELLRLAPNDPEALNNLGLTMKEMGKPDDAIRYFHEALRGKPEDALVYNNLGIIAMQEQRHGEAIAYFSEALRLQPHYMMAHYNLATELLKQAQYEPALEHSQTAVALNPYFPDAFHGLGAALIYLGRYEEAAVACQQALRLDPRNAAVLANLGVARYHQGRFRDAVQYLSQSLSLDPTAHDTSENLHMILSQHPELQ